MRDPGQITPLNDWSLFSLRSRVTNEEGNTTPDNDMMLFPRRIRLLTVDISEAARRHRGDVQIVQSEFITVAIRAGARGAGAGSG